MASNDLVALADVKAWLDVTTDDDDDLFAGLITQVSRATLAFLDRAAILPATYAETRDGGNESAIVLRQWPVTAIASLTIDGATIAAAPPLTAGGSRQCGYVLEPADLAPPGYMQRLALRGMIFPRGLPRVCATALLLFAIFALAYSAHAEGRAIRPTPSGTERAVTVFGRVISIGGASASEDPRQALHAYGVSMASPFGGFAFDAGAALSRVSEIVRARAEALGVPVALALAIAHYESGGRCQMRGRAGERGAMQVLPQTARSVGVGGNLYDCATGIEAALRYLRLAVSMHAEAGWCAVASAYNSGTWRGSRCTHYGRVITLMAGLR